jgi:hypothetical protein
MMTNMIERVARAMAKREGFVWSALGDGGDTTRAWQHHDKAYWIDQADTAINAMRYPTDEMIAAGLHPCDEEGTRIIWTDMIDAALTPKIEE